MSSAKGPRGVVIQAAVDWNFLKQRPHHFAETFAALGLPVLFIENSGTRPPSMRDMRRVWNRLSSALTPRRLIHSSPNRVEVYSPLAIPFPFFRMAYSYNRHLIQKRINRFLSKHRLTPGVTAAVTYLATPAAVSVTLDMPWLAKVYDVVSDPKWVEPRVTRLEQRLLREADLVLFASETLRLAYGSDEHFRTIRDGFSTELLHGCDAGERFGSVLPSPIFLYLGGLNRKVWVEALERIAVAFPGGTILLVGPVTPGEFSVPKQPNIKTLPPVSLYQDLAPLLRRADVALIPYVPDGYVSPMYPAKVNEYLVFGLPIIATATAELTRLADQVGRSTVYLAHRPEDFASQADRALREDSESARERRMTFAASRNWSEQGALVLEAIKHASSQCRSEEQ